MSNKKLTLSEMAERLSITPKTLNKYILEYHIPFIGLGRNKRFDANEVESFLKITVSAVKPINKPLKVKSVKRVPSKDADRYAKILGLA